MRAAIELEHTDDKTQSGWRGAVTLSFDDGWRSVYENSLPILQQAGIRATHYVIGDCLDEIQFPEYMNAEQILTLSARGHEIGCHTASHKHLAQESEGTIKREVTLSLKSLRALGLPVDTFAYPFGEYDERVVAAVKGAGFAGARSCARGFNDEKTDRFLLTCQAILASTETSEVIEWIDTAQQQGSWLILMFHQIDEDGREWSASPRTLQSIVDYIRKRQVSTLTVKGGLKALAMH